MRLGQAVNSGRGVVHRLAPMCASPQVPGRLREVMHKEVPAGLLIDDIFYLGQGLVGSLMTVLGNFQPELRIYVKHWYWLLNSHWEVIR